MRYLVLVAVCMLALAPAASARTKTEAAGLAANVNLTKSDMPGYKSSRTESVQLAEDPDFVRCAKTVPASKFVGFFPSKTFERETSAGFVSTYSEVDVLKSPALVQKDIAAYATKRARGCLARGLKREGGNQIASVTASAMKPAVPNGTGIRIKTIVRDSGMKIPSYLDVLIVGHEDVE